MLTRGHIPCRGDNKNLKTQNGQLRQRVATQQQRVTELEGTAQHHAVLQGKMRDRLRQMDKHSSNASTQVRAVYIYINYLIIDKKKLEVLLE